MQIFPPNVSPETIISQITNVGFIAIKDVLNKEEILLAKDGLEGAISREAAWHGTSKYSDFGMVMVCAMYGKIFIDLLANKHLMRPFNLILGDGSIVYAYTSSSMPPNNTNYSNRIHVDCPRYIPNYITNMACTIALDDFTEDNGASYLLKGSHSLEELPGKDDFFASAERFIAPAGSVVFFNARVVHAGGFNKTSNWRHALTLNMCRPWMKQRFDLPRLLENYEVNMSEIAPQALQKLGFDAQVPMSLEEYYAPKEFRKYRQATE